MNVDPYAGGCRTCGGALEITDADAATLTVACLECGDSYSLEPDAFDDDCLADDVPSLTTRAEEGDDDE